MEKLKINSLNNIKSIHFIGIGGISMSGLAKYCLKRNIIVSGSDLKRSNILKDLEKKGVKISYEHKPKNLQNPDLIVFTSAISPANLELIEAQKNNIPIMERGEFLGLITKQFARTISISGTHGKTTTTALLSKILLDAKLNPMVHLGGEVDFLDSNFNYGKSLLVSEACEYKDSFLHSKNYIGAILNIEKEHLDYFKTFDAELNSYQKFAQNSRFLFCDKSVAETHKIMPKNAKNLTTISTAQKDANWIAENISPIKIGGYMFDAIKNGKFYSRIITNLIGEHNIQNILFAISIADFLGVDKKQIFDSVISFKGVKRRMEKLGAIKNTYIYADYAHHPTEINSCITATKKSLKGNILFIFQPHTYSRTATLLNEFVSLFSSLKEDLIILPTFKARETAKDGITSTTLTKKIAQTKPNTYLKTKNDCINFIKKNHANYSVIMLIGAGDIYDMAKEILSLHSV